MSQLDDMLGTWAPHIGREFYKPYMKQIQEKIEHRKTNVFETFHTTNDNVLKVFVDNNYDNVKVLYIVDDLSFNPKHLLNIESEMCDGLCLPLSIQQDYSWLHKQGIMFFPLHLSWGDCKHVEWRVFTEEVLLKITGERNVLVVSNNATINEFITTTRIGTDIESSLIHWALIDTWIKKHYNTEIDWTSTK